jgi:hypothetical protein
MARAVAMAAGRLLDPDYASPNATWLASASARLTSSSLQPSTARRYSAGVAPAATEASSARRGARSTRFRSVAFCLLTVTIRDNVMHDWR